jgi:hypothetical protein
MLVDSLDGVLVNTCSAFWGRFLPGESDAKRIGVAGVHGSKICNGSYQPAGAATRIEEGLLRANEPEDALRHQFMRGAVPPVAPFQNTHQNNLCRVH